MIRSYQVLIERRQEIPFLVEAEDVLDAREKAMEIALAEGLGSDTLSLRPVDVKEI